MVKKTVLWILVVLTCLMIFNFSATKGSDSNKQSEAVTEKVEEIVTVVTHKEPSETTVKNIHIFVRKQGHFVEFALLGLLVFLLSGCYDFSVKKSIMFTLLFVFFYACTDEIHQLFVQGRQGRVGDVFIDFAGGILGTGVVLPFEVRKLRKETKKL